MAVFPVLGRPIETALSYVSTFFSKASVSTRLVVLGLLLLAFSANAHAGQVTLAWDANTDPELGGYKLYYGQTSGNYSANVNVGNQTSYTLTALTAGQTYYFAVKAYDRLGQNESAFSSEVQATIPISTAAPVANFTASSHDWHGSFKRRVHRYLHRQRHRVELELWRRHHQYQLKTQATLTLPQALTLSASQSQVQAARRP